jgi:phage terminase large subunit-like protein
MGAFKDMHIQMMEDLTIVRHELEQEMRELIESMIDKKEKQEEIIADLYQLLELVQKVKDTETELKGFDDGQ